MKDSVRRYWIEFNLPLEGRVNFMYCDRKGLVSTGVGNLIDATRQAMTAPTAAERAASLNMANQFQWTAPDGSRADRALVATDWDSVKSHLDKSAQGHRAFKEFTQLTLESEEIDRMIFVKLDEMEGFLKSRNDFTDFDGWPADAQLALLSMSWGMGPAFQFPSFQAFASQADWAGAATECHFLPDEGTIKIRNILDATSFRNAARVVDDGLDPELLVVDLTNTLGVQIALQHFGFKPGPTDGVNGPKTTAAVSQFQTESGVAPTGDPPDIAVLLAVGLTGDGFTALLN